MTTKICKKCGETKPLTTEFFNLLSSGHWRGSCKVCMAEHSRNHYYKHPEQTEVRRAKYKDSLRSAVGSYSDSDIVAIRKEQADRCFYCGIPLNGMGEIDHKIPLSHGGSNLATNLAISCVTCNRDKHNKTSDEFFGWRKKLGLPCSW